MHRPPETTDLTLSRELGDFLVEFSIALQSQAMYPKGHPSLVRATSSLLDRLVILLQDRPTLSLGIARHQLVIEGVATDPEHPVLRALSQRLHSHHLGAVTFTNGVGLEELVDVLKSLAAEPERGERPLGLRGPQALQAWPHIRLYSLTYEQLELVHEPGDEEGEERRAQQLWLGLARAAVAAEDEAEIEEAAAEPLIIARAINEKARSAAYDQVIVGYLLQLANELKLAGPVAESVRRRVSGMVSALEPETLQRLVEMGGDFTQREQFVLDATHAFALDALLEIVPAAARTSRQTVSHALIRLLSKLAVHAEQGGPEVRAQADASFREQVRELVASWALQDPNPEAYTDALERMARAAPQSQVAGEQIRSAEAQRMLSMCLEIDTVGKPLWGAVSALLGAGQLHLLFGILDGAPPESRVVEAVWRHVTSLDHVSQLLRDDPVDFEGLDRILARKGQAAAGALLDALVESESRVTRRGVFDRLVRMGPEIGPLVVERLADPRWYVQRNLLALLGEFEQWPRGFYPGPYAKHSDPRVRREALKLLLRMPAERDRALASALTDADTRVVQVGLVAAQAGYPEAAAPWIAKHASNQELSSELRLPAIRCLQKSSLPAVRDALLRVATAGRTIFWRPKLAPKSQEMLAALSVLATSWARDPRVSRVLARARKSRDREVRAAAEPEVYTG